MYRHRTTYRVIYGDTDTMGVVYYGNYLRLFEIGRAEMFRSLGLTYKSIEENGYFLPVSESFCRYFAPARYDDLLSIEAGLDLSVKGALKFDYRIYNETGETLLAQGYTKHAFMNREGRVVRPPGFFKDLIETRIKPAGE